MRPTTTFIINRILGIFNLELSPIGLSYVHMLNYGNIKYFITNDLKKVFKFIDLPCTPTDDIESLYLCISQSKYFNKGLFTKYLFDTKEYDEFIHYLQNEKPVDRFRPATYLADKAAYIDTFFGSNIKAKISVMHKAGFNKKELRNKFNGKLVMKWSGLTPGSLLAATMEEFKEHIEDKFRCGFLDYLTSRKPSVVRTDFLFYYNELDDILLSDRHLPY